MRVSELVVLLQQQDQNAEVVMSIDGDDPWRKVGGAEVVKEDDFICDADFIFNEFIQDIGDGAQTVVAICDGGKCF